MARSRAALMRDRVGRKGLKVPGRGWKGRTRECTRPGRKAEAVARWVHELAAKRTDAQFEIVDLKEFNLPVLDEATPAAFGKYEHAHTKAWAVRIAPLDGFVFVTPEYKHATSGALKNAIDFLGREWNNKAAGFVGYGSTGGVARWRTCDSSWAKL